MTDTKENIALLFSGGIDSMLLAERATEKAR